MPPDVQKASGLPDARLKNLGYAPLWGAAPFLSTWTEARSASAHQAAEPHRVTACYPSPVLAKFFGQVWRYLPGALRRRVVRLGQRRFTVTAGAFVFDDAGRLLLLEHEFRPDSRWGIPGGFLNKGEQPDQALRRELREEVALEIDEVEFLFARTLPRPRQVEIYFACKPKSVPTPSSFEIRKAAWFATDDLPGELSSDQRRMIKRAVDARENRRE